MDLFPETAIELGLIKDKTLPGQLSLFLRNWSMRQSALTICPIDRMARFLSAQGISADNLAVVHHWADKNEILPVDPQDNPLRHAWGLGDKFVIGYSGNFGRAHDFQTVLDAAEQLKASPEIVFLMIGEGQQRRYVEEEARRRGLSNIVMKPFQPVDQLSESLGAADVHLVSLKPELEHCIVPSKFYGVLAAARPTIFIGDPDGEIATVIRDFHCGVSLCPGEVEMLVSAILLLRNSQFNRKLMGNNARYLMETAYSREFGAAVWQSAVGRLLRKEPLPAMPILDRQLQAEKLQ
jgi:glycosyltransferase involved in cell wall biosynthesis